MSKSPIYLYYTGDIHGAPWKIVSFCKKVKTTADDIDKKYIWFVDNERNHTYFYKTFGAGTSIERRQLSPYLGHFETDDLSVLPTDINIDTVKKRCIFKRKS